MSFNRIWTIFYENSDLLLQGLWVTIQVSLIAFFIALVAGLLFGNLLVPPRGSL